jgi:hypothetical protein
MLVGFVDQLGDQLAIRRVAPCIMGHMAADDDFYEDDEPLEDVLRAFREGEKYVTEPPHQGVTLFVSFETAEVARQTHIGNPPASLVRC